MIDWGLEPWMATWREAWTQWMGPALVVEEAAAGDLDTLARIHAEAFPHAPWSADDLAALMRETTVTGLLARRSGWWGLRVTAGFVLMRSVAGEGEILTIAVDPRHRRRGIARALLEEVMRRLWRDRAEALFLEVDAGNEPAVALYRGLGFVAVGERRGYYANGSVPGATALVMRVDLHRPVLHRPVERSSRKRKGPE